MMETLAPRSTYDDDELGMTSRLPLVSGVFFGGTMGLLFFLEKLREGGSLPGAVVYALIGGGFSGVLYGASFPWLLGRVGRRVNDRIYVGDPKLVPPPPADRYLYRLPCGWLRRPNLMVGGVLYLGRGGLRFDPHLRNLARHREALVIEPLKDIRVDLVDTPLPRLLWVWGHRTLPRIRVHWPSGEAIFGIPGAAAVAATLQARIAALNQEGASTS